MLSDRISPGAEAAPWVIEEIRVLEIELSKCQEDLAAAYLEIQKLRPKAVFDRDVHTKARLEGMK
jgi:hypothetical protein